ncbi:MAG TPA: GNAT family protein [Pyrinomonadaceae bacterium]|jgi:RimJ/RimL family protein N-acetyltransferase|nr:GNAT family protein [Pyrinomonadaceae bacterium]
MEVVPVTLESEHVRLEPLTMAHEAALADAAADGELWNTQVTIIPRPEGMKNYIQFALDGLAQGNQLPFVIARKAQPDKTGANDSVNSANRIVGSTRFYEIFPQDRKCAIGYTWLARSAQRTSINTECKLLLLTHAFETWNCVRVELITDVLNEQSRAAILRLGARQEGILRKHLILPSGRVRDSVFFSITDDEWPEVKARLAAKLVQEEDR